MLASQALLGPVLFLKRGNAYERIRQIAVDGPSTLLIRDDATYGTAPGKFRVRSCAVDP
jgi:hypothetical protein